MKKKILSLALVVALLAIAVIGGTLAYFIDTDYETNVLVSGNVEIEIREENGLGKQDDEYRDWLEEQRFTPDTTLPKKVWVDNTGMWNDAYIRLYYAIPADLDPMVVIDWNNDNNWTRHDKYTVTRDNDEVIIDGKEYIIYCSTYELPVDEKNSTPHDMLSIKMDKNVNAHHNSDGTYTYYMMDDAGNKYSYTSDQIALGGSFVLVHARAVQADNMADATDAFDKAFGAGYAVNPWAAGEGGAVVVDDGGEYVYLYNDVISTENAITVSDKNGANILVEESNISAKNLLAEINASAWIAFKGCDIDVDNGLVSEGANSTVIFWDCTIELEDDYLINLAYGGHQVIFLGTNTINGVEVTNANKYDFVSTPANHSIMVVPSEYAGELGEKIEDMKK